MPKLPYSNQMDIKQNVCIRLGSINRAWVMKRAQRAGSITKVIEQLIQKEMENEQ